MQDIKTIEGTEVINVNDPIQGSHAITLNDLINKVRPYKVYTALLSQSGTNNPVATVLENTTGLTITWTRTGGGEYNANFSSPILILGKVGAIIGGDHSAWDGTYINHSYYVDTSNYAFTSVDSGNTLVDSMYSNTLIEIRIYP